MNVYRLLLTAKNTVPVKVVQSVLKVTLPIENLY